MFTTYLYDTNEDIMYYEMLTNIFKKMKKEKRSSGIFEKYTNLIRTRTILVGEEIWATPVKVTNVTTRTNVTIDNKCNKSTTNVTTFRLATN